jgi:hypothetical protein
MPTPGSSGDASAAVLGRGRASVPVTAVRIGSAVSVTSTATGVSIRANHLHACDESAADAADVREVIRHAREGHAGTAARIPFSGGAHHVRGEDLWVVILAAKSEGSRPVVRAEFARILEVARNRFLKQQLAARDRHLFYTTSGDPVRVLGRTPDGAVTAQIHGDKCQLSEVWMRANTTWKGDDQGHSDSSIPSDLPPIPLVDQAVSQRQVTVPTSSELMPAQSPKVIAADFHPAMSEAV